MMSRLASLAPSASGWRNKSLLGLGGGRGLCTGAPRPRPPRINAPRPQQKPTYVYPPPPPPPLNPRHKPLPIFKDPFTQRLLGGGLAMTFWIFLWECGYVPSPVSVFSSVPVGLGLTGGADTGPDAAMVHADAVVTSRVFMDIAVDGDAVGRVVIGVYGQQTPRTADNFIALASGSLEHARAARGVLSYEGVSFHRCVNNFCIQGGDVVYSNGQGGYSIYGRYFDDENFDLGHDGEGVVSMSNSGKDKNSSQFFVTLASSPALDGKHVVFGRVVSGMRVLRRIDKMAGSWNGVPKANVKVIKSGALAEDGTELPNAPAKQAATVIT